MTKQLLVYVMSVGMLLSATATGRTAHAGRGTTARWAAGRGSPRAPRSYRIPISDESPTMKR